MPLVCGWGEGRQASWRIDWLPSLTLDCQIERWWKELHERLEKYFKDKLTWLKNEHHYNPHDAKDRYVKMGCFCWHFFMKRCPKTVWPFATDNICLTLLSWKELKSYCSKAHLDLRSQDFLSKSLLQQPFSLIKMQRETLWWQRTCLWSAVQNS